MLARRPATSQGPRLSGAALLRPIAQLFWLVCCLWSYTVIARTWGYQGFVIVAPVGATRLIIIALALIGLSVLLPRRVASPADYVVAVLFDVSFVPFCAYWVFSNQPWWQLLLVTVYWALVLLISGLPVRIRLRYVNGAQNSALLVAYGLVLAGMILIVAGGHLTLRLPLADVYAVRTVWATEGSWITMYLFPWLGYVLLPFLCAHAWKNRKWVELVLLGFATYMLFTSTGMKGFLFMPVLVVAVLVIAEWRPPGSFVPLALGVFAIAMVLLDNITGSVAWSSLGLRRVLFVPAHLTSVYLEFFSINPVVHLSESILLRGWLTYPYPVSVPRMIGAFLGQPAMNSNNGLISDGFSNFGVVGALVWAVLLGIVILLLRAATRQREDRPEAWAVVAIWPDILLSGALTTALLTNGLVLGLLVAWALLPVRLTPRP